MIKIAKIISVLFLFLCLVLIRAFEDYLFYDPLLEYFKGDHLIKPIPDFKSILLVGSYTIRYFLNAIISIAILKMVFTKNTFLKTISFFYVLAFIVLMLFFFALIPFKEEIGYLILFYVRRFVIQPIFIILLFPLLYLLKKGYRL